MKHVAFTVLAVVLVALNAFFVATEFAIVRVRETRIDELVAQGLKRAVATKGVLANLNAYLSACQLGITLASLGLGWVGEPAFAHFIEPVFAWAGIDNPVAVHSAAITIAFIVITLLHVVFGELVPKTLAIDHAEATALVVAWPIRLFYVAFYPAIWAFNELAMVFIRALGLQPASEAGHAHSEEELRMILTLSRKSGVLSESHGQLLAKALAFADRTVRQIMIPRADIVFLDINRPYEENLEVARKGTHTRYPLCDGDLDRVIGVVHTKDLFQSRSGQAAVDLRAAAREPLFVPEGLELQRVLGMFQKQRMHLAIVIDEYGGSSGVVTLEDVLEELIGEIQDEFDQEPPKIHPLDDGRLSVDAGLSLDEIRERLGVSEDADEDVDTLGGYVLARLGRIARVGDVVDLGGHRVEVMRVQGRRIVRLAVDPERAKPASPLLGT